MSDLGVLEADGETTPVTESGDIARCDQPDCDWSGKPTMLGVHRWAKHKIRSGNPSHAKKAPAKKTSPPKTPRSTTGPTSKDLRARLLVSCQLVGTGVGMLDRYDGQIVHAGSPALANALGDWADADPAARKWIEMLAFDAPWFGVAMLLLSMGFPIAAHHGLIKNVPPMFAGLAGGQAPPAREAKAEPSPSQNGSGAPMDLAAAMQDPDFQRFAQGIMGGGFAQPFSAKPPDAATEPMGEKPAEVSADE